MALESGTFINDLVITNPPGTDPILQGDDHLRLVKNVLKATFPNADKAFAFPDAITKTAAYTVLKADINKFFQGDATTAAFSFTLPTLAAADDGWYAIFVKSDASANAVTLVGTINGVVNQVLAGQYNSALVWWSGTAWFSFLPNNIATASTTEVLAGTNTAKAATPDAIAALWEKGADVASAAIVSLGEGGYFHITGTTAITDIDFATAKDGRAAFCIFDGILTLTHSATTLVLPGGANIVTAAGDAAMFVQDAGDNVKCLFYTRAAAGGAGTSQQIFTSSGTWTKPSSGTLARIQCWGGGGSGGKGIAGAAQGGGGGGGYNEKTLLLSALGATETVTIGAGGVAQTVASTAGNAGGNTTFGAHLTAYGGGAGGFLAGGGGAGGGGGGVGGAGGNAVGGTGGARGNGKSGANVGNADGGIGGGGGATANHGTPGGNGSSWPGGGGGGAAADAVGTGGTGAFAGEGGGGGGAGAEDVSPGPGVGGDSVIGGSGGAGAFDVSNATAGAQPSGGGGGSEEGNSGAGGAGQVIVTVT